MRFLWQILRIIYWSLNWNCFINPKWKFTFPEKNVYFGTIGICPLCRNCLSRLFKSKYLMRWLISIAENPEKMIKFVKFGTVSSLKNVCYFIRNFSWFFTVVWILWLAIFYIHMIINPFFFCSNISIRFNYSFENNITNI